jgi:tRNA pseudouridine55 synthase
MNILQPNQPQAELPKGFVLLVDKPLGWTSFDVVNKVRYHLSKRVGVKRIKLGHAGTLDPLATGLLILCAGDYTRRIEEFQGQAKTYTGTMTFGAVTACYDLEKPIEIEQNPVLLAPEMLEAARAQQLGDIDQYPPVFSAVKVDGKRLYTNARKGTDIELQPRKVHIDRFEVSPLRSVDPTTIRPEPVNLAGKGHPIWCHPDYPDGLQADFLVECGKGTYIRSMAYDMGRLTGCGAYLSALRRTQIGNFKVDDAWQVADLVAWIVAEGT